MTCENLPELLWRLEHISADSIWAHRASGLRRSLARLQEALQKGEKAPPEAQQLIEQAYAMLEAAAKEIPPDEK